MPWRPPSHKPQRGRPRDYAESDAQRQRDPALAAAARLRHTARWRKLRDWHLRHNLLCADPFGCHARDAQGVLAIEVDHIAGLRYHPDLASCSATCNRSAMTATP
jgi:hypothetical protein